MIRRDRYLNKLIRSKGNGKIKVITGIRRCGKTCLLFDIFHQYLNSAGVDNAHIIELALDDSRNIQYRNPLELGVYLRNLLADGEHMYYLLLDEIQKVTTIPNPYLQGSGETIGFVDVLLGLLRLGNVDIYVTGSNARILSPDMPAEFREKCDEIRICTLSYREFYNAWEGDKQEALCSFLTYGGMPLLPTQHSHEEKAAYLHRMIDQVCLADIMAQHRITYDQSVLDDILDLLSSTAGTFTSPTRLAKDYAAAKGATIDDETVSRYLDYFADGFLINKVPRYDVKGIRYIGSPLKYYYADVGLLNARLGFPQTEENRIMETAICSELCIRDFEVDIGIVEYHYRDQDKRSRRAHLEVDFVANRDENHRYYIQFAGSLHDEELRDRKLLPLMRIGDSFRKLVVVKDAIEPRHDENGILYLGLEQFLLDENAMDI